MSALMLGPPSVAGFNIDAGSHYQGSIDLTHVHKKPLRSPRKVPYTWEPLAATSVLNELSTIQPEEERPLMVALVGIPGSGKSTSCHNVADLLEEVGLPCMIMPFDGYHVPIDDLKERPNADDAIYRRGAPDTFEPKALKDDLLKIRDGPDPVLQLPGFDHDKGDPQPNEHTFKRGEHKVVLCEGLYLLHDEEEWDLHECFDYSIFIESDVDLCMSRLKKRNKCIPGYDPDEIEFRVDAVDRVNANIVNRSKDRANLVVRSATF